PPANVLSLVVFREDEIGLHPGNPCPGINEQLGKPVCAQPAALVQIVPPLLRDGLNAALHRYAMRSSKQVQSALIPQVNARLQPNGDGTLCQALQQAMKAAADTEDFIDKVDIGHTLRDQPIHFFEHRAHIPFAVLVSEKRLVAERTGPRASAG